MVNIEKLLKIKEWKFYFALLINYASQIEISF